MFPRNSTKRTFKCSFETKCWIFLLFTLIVIAVALASDYTHLFPSEAEKKAKSGERIVGIFRRGEDDSTYNSKSIQGSIQGHVQGYVRGGDQRDFHEAFRAVDEEAYMHGLIMFENDVANGVVPDEVMRVLVQTGRDVGKKQPRVKCEDCDAAARSCTDKCTKGPITCYAYCRCEAAYWYAICRDKCGYKCE